MRALNPFVDAIRGRDGLEVAQITTWTRGGRFMGATLFGEDTVMRAPIPIRPFIDSFLRTVRPDVLVLEYLEWYPAWLRACARRGIPVVVIDGRISERSLRIQRFLSSTAPCINAFGAQSDEDAENALRMGIPHDRVHVTGNGKFDGFICGKSEPSDELRRTVGERNVVVGSLHPDEESACVEAIASCEARVLIAPRYMKRVGPLEKRLLQCGVPVARRSAGYSKARVMILDTLGELAGAYGLAPAAIIGGTFGRRGGQNLFEAALHNCLIIHGPSTHNVLKEVECLTGHGAKQVHSFRHAFESLTAFMGTVSIQTESAIRDLGGATRKNLALLEASIVNTI